MSPTFVSLFSELISLLNQSGIEFHDNKKPQKQNDTTGKFSCHQLTRRNEKRKKKKIKGRKSSVYL